MFWLVGGLLPTTGPHWLRAVEGPGPGWCCLWGNSASRPGYPAAELLGRLGSHVVLTVASCSSGVNKTLQLSVLASSQQCLFTQGQVSTQASEVTNLFCSGGTPFL